MKRLGITLSEVLISVAVIGIISVITLPILLKNTRTGSDMIMLKSILSNLEEVIRPELLKTGGKTLNGTTMLEKPREFLRELNTMPFTKGGFASSYKAYSTGARKLSPPKFDASETLANGAALGLKRTKISKNRKGYYELLVYIDVNGQKNPNIIGVDLFTVKISGINDYNHSIHVGDLINPRAVYNDNDSVDLEQSTAKCREGQVNYCYEAVLLSNFDPDYLDKY